MFVLDSFAGKNNRRLHMKVICSKIFKMNIIFIAVLLATSCNKKSDLLVEYVLSDDLHKEKLEGFAMDDFSKTNNDQGAVLDLLTNDIYTD